MKLGDDAIFFLNDKSCSRLSRFYVKNASEQYSCRICWSFDYSRYSCDTLHTLNVLFFLSYLSFIYHLEFVCSALTKADSPRTHVFRSSFYYFQNLHQRTWIDSHCRLIYGLFHANQARRRHWLVYIYISRTCALIVFFRASRATIEWFSCTDFTKSTLVNQKSFFCQQVEQTRATSHPPW